MIFDIDFKEMKERIRATQALAKENPKHFIDYCDACYFESFSANKPLRETWDVCWKAYQLEETQSLTKEDWQSDIHLPKAFSTVQQAKAIIRKALDTNNLYTVVPLDKTDSQIESFLKAANSIINAFQGERQGKFANRFIDAIEMGFVIGQSMEMIPRWKGGSFYWELVEPWKIFRDPNASCRNPWSGNYWIHEEWIDWWVLKELAKKGIIDNLNQLSKSGSSFSNSSFKEEETAKKGQIYQRHRFISSHQVREFWGTIVDENGELLLPNGRFAVCSNTLLKIPTVNPYRNIRFPGVSFSPIPHLLRFEGRGILEAAVPLLEFFNNLFNMHIDNLNWQINSPKELTPGVLIDPTDLDIYPGKILLKQAGYESIPALLESQKPSKTMEVLSNAQYIEKLWQNATFVSEFLEGLPGTRTDITRGEVELKTEQGLGVFHSIARDIEEGGLNALWAAYDIICYNLTLNNPTFQSALQPYFKEISPKIVYNLRYELPNYSTVSMSGINNLIKRMDTIKRLEAAMMKAESPVLGHYINSYKLLEAYFDILDLTRYEPLKNEQQIQQEGAQQNETAALAAMAGKVQGQSGSFPVPGGNSGQFRNLPQIMENIA